MPFWLLTIAQSHTRTTSVLVDEHDAGRFQGAPNGQVVLAAVMDVSLSAICTGKSFRRLGYGHEQSERAARKWRETKVAIEGRGLFIQCFDHDGENCERTRSANYPTDCIGEQKIADSFAANSFITRETSNKSSGNEVVAWQML